MTALHTPEALAERLGKSEDYWKRAARRREVPHVRLGRTIRFTDDDVAAIVAAAHVDVDDPLASQTKASRVRGGAR